MLFKPDGSPLWWRHEAVESIPWSPLGGPDAPLLPQGLGLSVRAHLGICTATVVAAVSGIPTATTAGTTPCASLWTRDQPHYGWTLSIRSRRLSRPGRNLDRLPSGRAPDLREGPGLAGARPNPRVSTTVFASIFAMTGSSILDSRTWPPLDWFTTRSRGHSGSLGMDRSTACSACRGRRVQLLHRR